MKQTNVYFEKMCFLCMILLLGLIISACATTNINQRTYQILKTSQSTYDLATDSIIALHKSGAISDSDYKKIKDKANIYAEAHNTAVDAIKAFNTGVMTADQTSSKLEAVSVALMELLKIAQPYILKLDKG
jgi:hypothetical protein